MTPEEVRRIIREELGQTTSEKYSFGDRVSFTDSYRAENYTGVGIVIAPEPDSDGDYRVAFPNGEWVYAQPKDMRRA